MFSLQIHSIFFLLLVVISTQIDGMNDTMFGPDDRSSAEYRGEPHEFIYPHRWPGGTVYYKIDDNFLPAVKHSLQYYMKRISDRVPCVRFAKAGPYTIRYIRWKTHPYYCHATFGRSLNETLIAYLSHRCLHARKYQQQLIFILGIGPMAQHPDRDQHIWIIWKNIVHDQKRYFKKTTGPTWNIPYDKDSITHYNPYALSKNGKQTIIHRRNLPFGHTQMMTRGDILSIKRLYGCA